MTDNRVDKIQEDITDIKITLAVNTQLLSQQITQLSEHMRRTDANEELIKIALTPILFLQRTGKIMKWVFGLGAAAATMYAIFK